MFVRYSRLAIVLATALAAGSAAQAHEGHDHDKGHEGAEGNHQMDHDDHEGHDSDGDHDATTGAGDLTFRYRADLSELPEEIAKGIKPAHGGFAKTPSGEIYFGLEGTGLIRLSADLKTKTLVSAEGDLLGGGLHNTTYLDRDGGQLVLPDNNRAQVLVVKLDGTPVGKVGRPEVNDYYSAKKQDGSPANGYAPTDTELGPDGVLYVCDGYSQGKYVLTVDLESMAYTDRFFGGSLPQWCRTEGKFSTNHGVTHDKSDDTLVIADRELQWAQKLTTAGEFVEGFDMAGANPCDVDFVEHGGETLMVAGCLKGKDGTAGVVQLLRDGKVVSTLKPKDDLGLDQFDHIHNAVGVVVDGKLFVLCYGWNPGCYAVLEHVAE